MKKVILAAALLFLGTQAHAADVDVTAPFMRAAPVVGGNGAAFFVINNHGAEDRLIGAEAGISKSVELHTHVKDGDVFRMRKVNSIVVPTHGTVELKPGGDHVMFIGLNAPVKEGTTVQLTLIFEKAGKVVVDLPVQTPGAMAPGAMPGGMPGGMAPGGAMQGGMMHDHH